MKWEQYNADTVRSAKDSDGVRLILKFADDFKLKFGYEMDGNNLTCPKCFRTTFQNFINKTTMADNTDYQLKPMYNGLSLGHGSQTVITQKNLTPELAVQFIKEHPRGKDLFNKLPQNIDELLAEPKEEPVKATKKRATKRKK